MFGVEDIKNSCDIILNSGCLNKEEINFLEKCKLENDPNKFLFENKNNHVLVSIFSKLQKIDDFINKKEE